MLIRFLKREIEGVGVQDLRDGRFSSPDLPLKEDLGKTAEAVKTGEAQKNVENVINLRRNILYTAYMKSAQFYDAYYHFKDYPAESNQLHALIQQHNSNTKSA